ncbi:DUF2268 domain-containing protein [Bacillus sp. FJAT-22090]|uniref:DUF2268 domain-containing protein n=1 Tax=Bacillus sp. FJAT-22090 TaxID=1581038 RepID=UPI00119FCB69|nr:DUF2268 domain-containing putative Zn-dependent protease [Bacillus sp. FJAT-22090]
MPVIQTQNWLNKFVKLCEEKSGREANYKQSEIICEPLMKFFPQVNVEVVHYELLRNGLFQANEWRSINKIVKRLEEQDVWQIVKQEYKLLRKMWSGPKVSIYIFPIKNANAKPKKGLPPKNGVAYKGAIFLFLTAGLPLEEIKALLAHEYNHVCRLAHLNLSPDKIPLRDSLIIEGLGEYAVKELYGEKWLAPWVDLYPLEESMEIWKKYFLPSLDVKGVKHHQPFLYGQGSGRLPKWIGYHIGYQIVHTFQEKHGPFKNGELYTKSCNEIIKGSNYPINQGDI